ncbi:unnamed protein product [Heterobilharzia americana]|nr:unnamed protein product [Heterobilharzia americana]
MEHYGVVNNMKSLPETLNKKRNKSTFILKDTRSHKSNRMLITTKKKWISSEYNNEDMKKKQSSEEITSDIDVKVKNQLHNNNNNNNNNNQLKSYTIHKSDLKNLETFMNDLNDSCDQIVHSEIKNGAKSKKASFKQINNNIEHEIIIRNNNINNTNHNEKNIVNNNKQDTKNSLLEEKNSQLLPNLSKVVDFLLPNENFQSNKSNEQSSDHCKKSRRITRDVKTLSASWKPTVFYDKDADKQTVNRKQVRDSMQEKGYGKLSSYKIYEKLGEGTYATVYKGYSLVSKQPVALKRIRMRKSEGAPCTAIREISLLRGLNHANIVKLHDVIYEMDSLTLVFEFGGKDLKNYMRMYNNYLPMNLVRLFTFQIFRGLEYCHAKQILHRDLKPQNLLINKNGDLKLADFGLARSQSVPIRTYSSEVVTLWYRPPDVLLGDKNYSGHIDIWGVGCILYEMTTGYSLFPGTSKEDQVKIIFQKFGIPPESYWPGLRNNPKFLEYYNLHQNDKKNILKRSSFSKSSNNLFISNDKSSLKVIEIEDNQSIDIDTYNKRIMSKLSWNTPRLNQDGRDLLFECLALIGHRRITAFNALNHIYFKNLLSFNMNVNNLPPEQSIVSFTIEHCTLNNFKSLHYQSQLNGDKNENYKSLVNISTLNSNDSHQSNEISKKSKHKISKFIKLKESQKLYHHYLHNSPRIDTTSDTDISTSLYNDCNLSYHQNTNQYKSVITTMSLSSLPKAIESEKKIKLPIRKYQTFSSTFGNKFLYYQGNNNDSFSDSNYTTNNFISSNNHKRKKLTTVFKQKISLLQLKKKESCNRLNSSLNDSLNNFNTSSISLKSQNYTQNENTNNLYNHINYKGYKSHTKSDEEIIQSSEKEKIINQPMDDNVIQKCLSSECLSGKQNKTPLKDLINSTHINQTIVNPSKPFHIIYRSVCKQYDKINSEYIHSGTNFRSQCNLLQINNQPSELIKQIPMNDLTCKGVVHQSNISCKSWNSSGSSNLNTPFDEQYASK